MRNDVKQSNNSGHLVVQTAWLCRALMELAHGFFLDHKFLHRWRARHLREHEVVREVVGEHFIRGPDHQRGPGVSACSRKANLVNVMTQDTPHWSRHATTCRSVFGGLHL